MNFKEVRLDIENLKKIKKIDSTFYKNEELTLDWYLERYNSNHRAIILENDKDEYVGYLVSVPVTKELYVAIKNGILLNDIYINPQHFLNESNYNYLVSILILNEYRNKGYGKKILEFYLEKNINNKCCALAITDDGFRLCNKKMNLVKILNKQTAVFVKE